MDSILVGLYLFFTSCLVLLGFAGVLGIIGGIVELWCHVGDVKQGEH